MQLNKNFMKKILFLLVIVVSIMSCDKKQDPFEWNNQRIGHLTKDIMVYQLDSLYANDSLVKPIKGDEFSNGPSDIEVFEKGGKHLLSLTPKEDDSTSTIEYIRVRDNRYKTDKGITIESDFKTISEAYTISSIDQVITDAIIRLKGQDFYFTIDKEVLPNDVKFDMNTTIEQTMIPDNAQPQYVFISW